MKKLIESYSKNWEHFQALLAFFIANPEFECIKVKGECFEEDNDLIYENSPIMIVTTENEFVYDSEYEMPEAETKQNELFSIVDDLLRASFSMEDEWDLNISKRDVFILRDSIVEIAKTLNDLKSLLI